MIQKQAEAVEALTGNATSVGEISVSRIDEPAVCEQFLAWFECRPAAGISAARVGAENESLYGRSMVDSCRVPRRSLSLCTLLGAAVSLIDERRRCWESCFPFARMVCPTRRCGVVPLQSAHGSISGSPSQPSTTGQSPGANPFPQPSVSALPLTEPMFELMG